jgi:predicted nuclease of predicted toxin-antitoxin system
VKFLADECFSNSIVRALVVAGFDVKRSQELLPSAPDELVLAFAYREGRILLTEDNDFDDLVVRLGFATHGVVRVALDTLDRDAKCARGVSALQALGPRVGNAIVTIEERRTRVRALEK